MYLRPGAWHWLWGSWRLARCTARVCVGVCGYWILLWVTFTTYCCSASQAQHSVHVARTSCHTAVSNGGAPCSISQQSCPKLRFLGILGDGVWFSPWLCMAAVNTAAAQPAPGAFRAACSRLRHNGNWWAASSAGKELVCMQHCIFTSASTSVCSDTAAAQCACHILGVTQGWSRSS
jgi:hypothetical protein